MADPELAALRAARLNQLQQSAGVGGANPQSGTGAGSNEEAEKRRAEEQMRRDLLATALEPAARERRTCHSFYPFAYLPQKNGPRELQCLALLSCRQRGRIRSSLSSCGCYNPGSSADVLASNSSSTCLNRCVL